MLATLVIGLREGLEAALIVSIIAAFLRRNGRGLAAMWTGVALAVLLSGAVGAALAIVEQSLPQAGQEGMEAVIGAVAIFFVTGMVFWMNTHAREMRADLEAEAAAALGDGRAQALAVMAFLAVLKEGFETAVFLLATFSAAQSATLAALGAVVGVLAAVVIGAGIYLGGVRINLGRFFRVTGAFLILVAAGLVMTTLRSAHEAGWLNAGQHRVADLSWLVRPGSVQSALITGVLGIQPDPRLVEVVGWFAYLIPVALVVYWPVRCRPSRAGAARLRLGIAGALAAGVAALALLGPSERPARRTAPVRGAADDGVVALVAGPSSGSRALDVALAGRRRSRVTLGAHPTPTYHAGVTATQWQTSATSAGAGARTITLERLVALNRGRVPLGLDLTEDRGPFAVRRAVYRTTTAWVAGGALLDASQRTTSLVTLSGGGLSGTRTISLPASGGWQVTPGSVQATLTRLSTRATERIEHRFWGIEVPLAMALIALILVAQAFRGRASAHAAPVPSSTFANTPTAGPPARSNDHAVQ